MTIDVTDVRSNKEEQIESASRVLKKGTRKRLVFDFVSKGKKRVKKVSEIASALRIQEKEVLDAGKKLSTLGYVRPVKIDKRIAYEKVDFFAHHRREIYRLADSPIARSAYVTKRNPRGSEKFFSPRLSRRRIRVRQIFIDDVDSFARVRAVAVTAMEAPIPESTFRDGVLTILGEGNRFKGWAGEKSDAYTTRVRIKGRRVAAAFAFKGPGQKGPLTPARMGKNGDQIARLFQTPSELFVVQFWSKVDDSIVDELRTRASLRSYAEDRQILFMVIDGQDSARLERAYPQAFGQRP